MGTNYYAFTGEKVNVRCDCGFTHQMDERLHIGKNSYGWMFSLHAIPQRGLFELDDWKEILKSSAISDEYGTEISYDEMIGIIMKSSRRGELLLGQIEDLKRDIPYGCAFDNESCLLYHGTKGRFGNYCIVEGEFS